MKISINNNQKTPRQNPARGTLAKPVAALITALFVTVLLGGTSVRAVQYWVGSSEADWNASTNNWFTGLGHSFPSTTDQTVFTNGVPCDFGSAGYSTDFVSVVNLQIGTSNSDSGTINMSGGVLQVTNSSGGYLYLGGDVGTTSSLVNAVMGNSGSIGTFNMSGGSLYISHTGSGNNWQNMLILGIGTNSTGTFTTSGGTASIYGGIAIGINGPGTVNVGGSGTLIGNSTFEVGAGCGATNASNPGGLYSPGSSTFNLTGGQLYICRNIQATPWRATAEEGLAINQSVSNATVNISSGTLYCHQIGLDANKGIPPTSSSDTLNISGGTIYIGDGGVNSNSYSGDLLVSQAQSVNISGGTFRTLDMLICGAVGATYSEPATYTTNGSVITTNIIVEYATGTFCNTNSILTDGTNWTWAVDPPVNLTNTAFTVLGTNSGPGYVTFAPEATRVITLSNVWSGSGGFVVTGPGQVIMAGANTYTGNTTVSGGELSLSGGGAIASPIIVAPGATFDVSGLTSTFALAPGQTLSNSSPTAILNGSAGSGSGTISLTYASGTPSFNVANGTLTLSAGTVFNVNNTGLALVPGTYTLIGTSGGGLVAGPVPSSYVVAGNGVSGGDTSSLKISTSNTLDLVVVASSPVVSPIISGSSVKVNGSGNPTFSGTLASVSTKYGVESTTSLSGSPVWIEAGTTTTDVNGAWSFIDITQTNPPTIFYRLYNPDTPLSPPQGH